MVEFRNRDDVEQWLKDRPPEYAVVIAVRSALRTLPLATDHSAAISERSLASGRAILASLAWLSKSNDMSLDAAVAAVNPAYDASQITRKVQDYATLLAADAASTVVTTSESARRTLYGANSVEEFPNISAFNTSANAVHATVQAYHDSNVPLAATAVDATTLEALPVETLLQRELWHGVTPPQQWVRGYKNLRDFWQADADTWDFWERWYESMVTGQPLSWDLQYRDAIEIQGTDWEAGAERVAERIAEIEASGVSRLLRERVELSETQRLRFVPLQAANDTLLPYLLDTVRDSLDQATSQLSNGLPKGAYQAQIITRALERYANDPQRIEMDFERARASLMGDMAEDAIPSTAANRDLIQNLGDAAAAIRDSNAEIAEARERLNRLRFEQLSEEDGRRIADAAEAVAAVAEDDSAKELREDALWLPGVQRGNAVPENAPPLGTPERNVVLEAQAAQLRVVSRLAKTWLYLKSLDRSERITLIGTIASVISVIVAFVVN